MNRKRISAARLGLEFVSITSEVRFNGWQVTRRIEYYRQIVAQVDSLRQERPGRTIEFSDLPGWSGAAPPLLRTASYDAAMNTGAFIFQLFIDMTPEVIHMYDQIGSGLEQAGYGTTGLS